MHREILTFVLTTEALGLALLPGRTYFVGRLR
jgi:hypothetical protein